MKKPNAPLSQRLNSAQRKYLDEQLSHLLHTKERSRHDIPKGKEPAQVVLARKALKHATKIINAYERGGYARRDKLNRELKEAYRKAHETLLFGTVEEALSAVKAFERLPTR